MLLFGPNALSSLTLSLFSLFTTVRFLCVGSFTFLAAYVPKIDVNCEFLPTFW